MANDILRALDPLVPPIKASDLSSGAKDAPSQERAVSVSPAGEQLKKDEVNVEEAMASRDESAKAKPTFPKLAVEPQFESDASGMRGYVSAIGILGAIGSMFTRRPMTNSMNAAAAAINSMKQGDAEDFKQKFDTWKVQNDNALKLFNYQNDTYKDIMSAKNKSVDERLAEMKANAAAFKDDNMMQLLEARNPAVIDDLLARADAARAMAEKHSADVEATGLKNYTTLQALQQVKEDFKAGKITKEQFVQNLQKVTTAGKGGAGAGDTKLTPEAIHAAAITYNATGQMPNLGMGGKEDKEAVLNESAKLLDEQGISPEDIVANRASYKADSASLTTLTKAANTIEGFETTAKLNMQNALSLMDKGAGTEKGPVINRWLQAGRKATGDPDVAAFNAALYTASTEYAKVMSGAVSAQALTDSARKEAEDKVINAIDSPRAIRNVYEKVMVPDMKNRKAGYDEQLSAVKKSLRGAKEAPSVKEFPPPIEGAKQAPDGKWYVPDPARPGKYLQVGE